MQVTNTRKAPVERGGIVFPARSTTEAELSEDALAAVRACPYLEVHEPEPEPYEEPELLYASDASELEEEEEETDA